VFSPDQTRKLSTAERDEVIQPVGPARFKPSCSCGGTCPKCSSRNPEDLTDSSDSVIFHDDAAGTRNSEIKTQDGGGGAAAPAAPVAPAAPAAPARSARLASGPKYTPNGSLTPAVAGGLKSVAFDLDGVFDSDPAAGVFPGCGEIHQDIKWDAAAAASLTAITGNPVPHGGFPATHPPNVWIEDRDTSSPDGRFGRRSGPHSQPWAEDQYTTGGVQDMPHGATYHGHDPPGGPEALAGRWTFMLLAFDMCNHGVQIGSADFITIDW
jgi:hypothetical protein